MGRKPKIIWAECRNELYIKIKYCVIPTLIILIDGLQISRFKRNGDGYIKATIALNWFKKELEHGKKNSYSKAELKRYKETISMYEEALENFKQNKNGKN